MKTRIKFSHRLLSLLLCVAMLAAYLPAGVLAANSSADIINKVADPSTLDNWKNYFPTTGNIHTENAGGVWTDKTVLPDATALSAYGITQNDPNSFLVALSAMGSNMSITGTAAVPTDTVLVLDMSSSMDRSGSVPDLAKAANDAIADLLALNTENRVGVVFYSGHDNTQIFLPLDHYTAGSGGEFLVSRTVNNRAGIAIASGVRNSNGNTVSGSDSWHSGTFTQGGVYQAMKMLLSADAAVTGDNERMPIIILMTDGEPSLFASDYSGADGTANALTATRTNTTTYTGTGTEFLVQLTAAYAKYKIDEAYEKHDLRFYSLGFAVTDGGVVADYFDTTVLNPAGNNDTDGYWTRYLNNESINLTINNYSSGYTLTNYATTLPAFKAALKDDANDRTNGLNKFRYYADAYYQADSQDALGDVFQTIVSDIEYQSQYFPTLVQGSEHMSGYVSFVDRIGKYMQVTDIKGITINGSTLFSGADLASNFVPGGGKLGTFDNSTTLGDNLVWAIMERLGLKDAAQARTLIGLAYENGQLSYNSETGEFSNYIGWYANAAGEFLGFWHEGITTMPAPTGDAATDPVFINKSYGYLGVVNGRATSDMMYAIVQVREEISTGEQTVIFGVPAALIPTVSYDVTLDSAGDLTELTVSGATDPIRLVYEVALDPDINAFTIHDLVDADYVANNTAADGSVHFYSNQYELTTGKDKVNTYSYFRPSVDNDRYYYQTDALIYTDTNGTLYRGGSQPSGTMYHAYTVYRANGTTLSKETVYHQLTDQNLSTSVATDPTSGNSTWYVPTGNARRDYASYTASKAPNNTDSLPYYAVPYTEITGDSAWDAEHDFVVGVTMGNNGRLSITPTTGIALKKIMAAGATAPTSAFRFTISNLTDPADSATYPAQIIKADGTRTEITVQFAGGQATVDVNAGETLYLGGMSAGVQLQITEDEILEYVPDQATQVVTLTANQLSPVSFVNADRGSGNLTIAKEVLHNLGTDYTIPAGLTFNIQVQLSGIGTASATFDVLYNDGTTGTITTDANGGFSLTLAHNEQFTVLGLPAGTVATITEPNPGTGFAAAYWEGTTLDDGVVTILDSATVSVTVVNTYTATEVSPVNVILGGTKVYNRADWGGAVFEFQLQQWVSGAWSTIATAEATQAQPTFTFDSTLQALHFDTPGDYYFQVVETNGGQVINGVTYDDTLHTFGIIVTDSDMDGKLEISNVVSYNTGTSFTQDADGNWQISIRFQNTYDATGCSLALDVQKALVNDSGSPLVSLAGFQFGLYDASGALVATSGLSDGVGNARFHLNYTYADVGVHTYTLKELVPASRTPGMSYAEAVYTVEVTVRDEGNGTTSASITGITSDGAAYTGTPLFTNTYTVNKAELEIDFVNKVLTGRDQNAGEFSFELRDQNGDVVLTGTNGADGKVTFHGALSFDQVGTYYYTIRETGSNGNGVTLDTTVYELVVTVTDAGGNLAASYRIANAVGNTAAFQNSYTSAPVEWSVGGNKVLTGRTLMNDEFTFILTQTDKDGNELSGGTRLEAKNFTDGSFRFSNVTFDAVGTYYFVVSELASSSGYGIHYDTTRYLVTVQVTDDLKGKLVASETIQIIGGGATNVIAFENKYIPNPTTAQIPGSKVLEGKILSNGEFSFQLYSADASWNANKLLETVQNAADGSFAFSALEYKTAGTWYYLVQEVNGGQTIDGVTYDSTVYRIRIQVTDDLRGQLHASVSVYDDQGNPRADLVFTNSYTVTGTDEVTIEGNKVLSGMTMVDGQFSFELYDAEGKLLQTVTNKNGKFSFTLGYTAADAGKTFTYTVKEANGGLTIAGITYDETVYTVTVEVKDNGKGGITATASINADDILFVNTYTEAPPSTGDNLMTWLFLLMLSTGAILTLAFQPRKKFENA